METEYRGIDYGRGITNIDTDTGIRYGIIPQYQAASWIHDDWEYDYGTPNCPQCGKENIPESEHTQDYYCKDCEQYFYSDECYPDEPLSLFIKTDEYELQLDNHGDIWVFKSPYITRAQFCSPCAPGACYLLNYCSNGDKAYCLGPDYFENEPPYPYEKLENTNVQ
jgi:hypothetical protein